MTENEATENERVVSETEPEPTNQKQWHVAVIEDHALVVAGLRDLINTHPNMELIFVSDEIWQLDSRKTEIDLAIVDLGLPKGWVEVADLTPAIDVGVKIVVVTGFAAPRMVRDLYLAGVSDVISKADPPKSLGQALDRILEGDDSMSVGVAAAMANFADQGAPLSNREQQVLALYGSGLKINAVAHQLNVTENTVKEYLKRIRHKLSDVGRPASTQRDLYQEAIREGLIK